MLRHLLLPRDRFSSALLVLVVVCLLPSTKCDSGFQPTWMPTALWGRCSPSCGPGKQQRVFVCAQEDRYNTTTLRPDRFCGAAQDPSPDFERPCNWGDCDRRTWWRTSEWSQCSQPCGDQGFTAREVECVMKSSEEEIGIDAQFESAYCEMARKPESTGICNRFSCPAEFKAMEWEKCEQSDPCKSGFQTRQLACRSLDTNGVFRELPKTACYMGRKPPPSIWRRCFLTEKSALCTQKDPAIDEVKMVVVQMRDVRRMSLQVGQEAYILPGTRLNIKCPVKFFPGSKLIWKHANHEDLVYVGRAPANTEPRFVGKSGNLVIRAFSRAEAGEWRCHAGGLDNATSAPIMLHYHLPSQGLSDWVVRNARRNTDMQNEDPHVVMTRQKLVQWVEGAWSNCSVPCGGQGVQTRTVRCEMVDLGVYHVLDDQECMRNFLAKPKTQRVCTSLPKCPTWQLKNSDYTECTDSCVAVGRGSFEGYLACMLSGSEIPAHHCEKMTKPDITCDNPACVAKWEVSDWSNCSVLCGGDGFRYRIQKCVWAHNGRAAGSACYDAKIKAPPAVESCSAKPCKTLCVDLSSQCPKYSHWCGFHTFKYNCCKTCRDRAAEGKTND